MDFATSVEAEEGIEGYVIAFENGHQAQAQDRVLRFAAQGAVGPRLREEHPRMGGRRCGRRRDPAAGAGPRASSCGPISMSWSTSVNGNLEISPGLRCGAFGAGAIGIRRRG